jgi:LEA14-like dessication related protein
MLNTNLVFFLLLITFLASGCITYNEVEMHQINSVRVNEFGKGNMVFVFNVKLENPNKYNIKVKSADLKLYIGSADAGNALLMDKLVLRKKSLNDYDLRIETNTKQITKALAGSALNILINKNVPVKVKGYIKAKVFIFGKKFPVEFKENVDIKDLPRIGH